MSNKSKMSTEQNENNKNIRNEKAKKKKDFWITIVAVIGTLIFVGVLLFLVFTLSVVPGGGGGSTPLPPCC